MCLYLFYSNVKIFISSNATLAACATDSLSQSAIIQMYRHEIFNPTFRVISYIGYLSCMIWSFHGDYVMGSSQSCEDCVLETVSGWKMWFHVTFVLIDYACNWETVNCSMLGQDIHWPSTSAHCSMMGHPIPHSVYTNVICGHGSHLVSGWRWGCWQGINSSSIFTCLIAQKGYAAFISYCCRII